MAKLRRRVRSIFDVYKLPHHVPFTVRLVGFFVLVGVPVPLLWWLALPHTGIVVGLLGALELAIVFAGLWRLMTMDELTRHPRRRPIQPPSTRPLDPPGAR